ncbi:hypothetical protein ACFRMQ_00325 [Kitasatospora sp. NPDC056783]|uniref:hypothetical protein n=1 Tax=Kitasatospora sp. NPDC056783 TaxID=3345943 RepID=UPI0036C07111
MNPTRSTSPGDALMPSRRRPATGMLHRLGSRLPRYGSAAARVRSEAAARTPSLGTQSHPVAVETAPSTTDLPDLTDGFALRDRLVRLAQAVLRADELASHRPTFGTAEVYLAEARHGVDELLRIVRDRGWPSVQLVGRDGLDAALVLAQAAGLEVQLRLRPALAGAVHQGGVPESHLVHLTTLIARVTGDPIDDADRLVPRTGTWQGVALPSSLGGR